MDMNIITWLVAGGIIGWLASILMHTAGQRGLLLGVVVGVDTAPGCSATGRKRVPSNREAGAARRYW
jgi:hypothetical protein